MFSADKPLPPPPLLPKPRNESAAAQSTAYRSRPAPARSETSGFSAARAMFEAAQRPEVRAAAVTAAKDPKVRGAVATAAKDERARQFVLNAFAPPQNREPPQVNRPVPAPAPAPKPALTPSQTANIYSTPAYKPTPVAPAPPPKLPPPSHQYNVPPKPVQSLYPSISAELASLNIASPSAIKNKTAPQRPPPPRSKSQTSLFDLDSPHAIVKFPYNSAHADELSCQAGDSVLLKKEVDSQWVYAMNSRTGMHGIVPIGFLDIKIPLAPTATLSSSQTYHNSFAAPYNKNSSWNQPLAPLFTSSSTSPYSNASSTPSPPKTGLAVISNVFGRRLRAKYDYNSLTDGDLNFEIYDEILVKERVGEEWLFGECKGRSGIFPANFVESGWETLPMRSGTGSSASMSPAPVLRVVTASYDYDSGVPEDLKFRAGDRIEEVGPEWVRGRLYGTEGLVPVTFLTDSSAPVSPAGYGSATHAVHHPSTPIGTVTAIADYHSTENDHLYFSKGDVLVVTEYACFSP